uniref:Dihydroorotase, mitochondrial n=5 Tax=Glycine subgen. Soja TaxID=1462606 RepID=A0A0R0JV11_SOYBN
MENTFILALEATVLQILEVWDTLCIAESENEEESNYDGSKRRYQSDRYIKVLIEKRLISIKMELTITQPDDWHLHLRDGSLLQAVLPHSAKQFGRAIVMPNLKPPITTTSAAVAYRESILKAIPKDSNFNPLMTLYLTDMTTPDEIKLAKKSGLVYGVKLYPAGATTNSQDGVTDIFGNCFSVLEEMAEKNLPLLVHGEVTNSNIDIFDREKVFIETILEPLVQRLPQLKVVMEHITTADAVKFVESCKEGYVAATVTPQHLLLNRNALFQSGLQPHNYCLPVLKREIHRQAIVSAVTSGSKRFFLGTDSAPHDRRNKECSCGCAGIYNSPVALSLYAKVFEEAGALDKLEAFTSFNGPDFYGLPRNKLKIRLRKAPWKVPDYLSFPFGDIVPMFAGETLEWEALPC